MPPIDHPCPQCDALPGQRCRNYLGHAQAPHRDRGKAPKAKPAGGNVTTKAPRCRWCNAACPDGSDWCSETCAELDVSNPA